MAESALRQLSVRGHRNSQPWRHLTRVIGKRGILVAAALGIGAWLGETPACHAGTVRALLTSEEYEAIPTTNVSLEEQWSLAYDDSDPNSPLMGLVSGIAMSDDGTVALLDYQLAKVHLVDAAGKYVASFGGPGRGPGDLERPSVIWHDDESTFAVMMPRPLRVARWTTSGEFLETRVLEAELLRDVSGIGGVGPWSGGYVLELAAITYVEGDENQVRSLAALEAATQSATVLYSEKHVVPFANPTWEERSGALHGRWATLSNGLTCVADRFFEYSLSWVLPSGEIVGGVGVDCELRRRSALEKQAIFAEANANPALVREGTDFQIENFDRTIQSLHAVRDDGVWVLTSHGLFDRPQGTIGVFDVVDPHHGVVQRIVLHGDYDPDTDRLEFVGDRVFIIYDHESVVKGYVGIEEEETDEVGSARIVCFKLDE